MKTTLLQKRNPSVTLARALSKLGYCSRSQAVEHIQRGDVQVNGRVEKNPSFWCDMNLDKIELKGTQIPLKQFVYVMMNKPKGVVTTRSDELSRTTVYELLEDVHEWVFPVGRLDKESSGLLLLTNDNQLGERLTSPESKIRKTYQIKLDKAMTEKHQQVIRKGMILDDEQLLPAEIKTISEKHGEFLIEMTIVEGKNRQIRRMCEELGYTVVELTRTKIGLYDISMLNNKTWKYLLSEEIEFLVSKKQQSREVRTNYNVTKPRNDYSSITRKKQTSNNYAKHRK
ncbi:MAG: rRNA pseudouridine synthase [Ignavibacteriae bacterium]|nr:rRNA pseudouridine synthase [Ignavibacteriota bacterium]